jgi:hypothetical protein
MDHYVSEPISLAESEEEDARFERADLIFYGVDHSGPSYEARIFLNNPAADLDTPRDSEHGYAGSFTVFGHFGCYGDEGHCDTEQRETDEFDLRPVHPLTPQTKTVVITDALRRVGTSQVQVTVVPVTAGDEGPIVADTLRFDRVRLLTYDL